MKRWKVFTLNLLLLVSLVACQKSKTPAADNNASQLLSSTTNINEPVKPGETNCIDPITGKIRLKAVVESPQNATGTFNIRLNSKTEKLYPSGGYMLVFELVRSSALIKLEYKQVHTSCGNPAVSVLLPATSIPRLADLAAGNYPIEIKVGNQINKGILQVVSTGTASLVMQTSNGIIIE